MRINASLAVLLLCCCAAQAATPAETASASKSDVEAAFLYNFALLTEWPDLPASEFRICVLGSDSMLAALEPVKKKQVRKLPVSVEPISTAAQARSCRVLFVGSDKHDSIGSIARQIGNAPVLVVSEEDGYDPRDVSIILVMLQGRIAFKINRTTTLSSSLAVSSKLLKLALQVY